MQAMFVCMYIGKSELDHENAYEPWFVAVIVACVGSALWMTLCTVSLWIYRCRQQERLKNSKNIDKTSTQCNS